MRILHVGNLYPPHDHGGGYEQIWHAAVQALRAEGHHCRVVSTGERIPGRDDGAEPDVHRELRWSWADHAFLRRSPRAALALERHSLRTLTRHLDAFAPEVVAWWSMGGLSLSLLEAVRRRGVPAVAFVLDDWLDYGRRADAWHALLARSGRPGRRIARAAGVPDVVRFADAAHYAWISRFTRAHAWRDLSLPAGSILPAGIADAFLASTPPDPWAWRLLCVGRIDPRKGQAVAVAALAELPDAATLTVVGDGDPMAVARLREQAQALGVADRLRLVGARPRATLGPVYAAADAVLFPTVWEEPWGVVPLEAMGAGRPVVASGTGGSAEYLRDGENALLASPGDATALAARVRQLAGDAALRERLRRGGEQTASGLTESRYHAGVEATLRAVVAGGQGTPPVAGGAGASAAGPRGLAGRRAQVEPREPGAPVGAPGADGRRLAPRLTVVVPDHPDRTATVRLLADLAEQEGAAAVEVLVAGTLTPPPGLAVRAVSCGSPPLFLDAARRAARAPVVLFLAAGCRPAPGLLAAHLALHARRPEPWVGALGRVGWAPGAHPGPVDRWWRAERFAAPPLVAGETGPLRFDVAHGSVKTALLAEVGDGLPDGGPGEELAHRLAEAGLRLAVVDAEVGLAGAATLEVVAAEVTARLAAEERLRSRRPWLPAARRRALEADRARGPGAGRALRLGGRLPAWVPGVGPAVARRVELRLAAQVAAHVAVAADGLHVAGPGADGPAPGSGPGGGDRGNAASGPPDYASAPVPPPAPNA